MESIVVATPPPPPGAAATCCLVLASHFEWHCRAASWALRRRVTFLQSCANLHFFFSSSRPGLAPRAVLDISFSCWTLALPTRWLPPCLSIPSSAAPLAHCAEVSHGPQRKKQRRRIEEEREREREGEGRARKGGRLMTIVLTLRGPQFLDAARHV